MPDAIVEVDLVIEDDRWNAAISDIEHLASRAVVAAFSEAGYAEAVSLCILLADDVRLRTLNREFRGKDETTNVLSFPINDGPLPGASCALGDIAIAYETVEREAGDASRPLLNHTLHLIVHGSLHLIGYTHEIAHEAEKMESLEVAVLARLGIPSPYEVTEGAQF